MANEVAMQIQARAVVSARSRRIAMKTMAVTIFHRVADPEVFDGWIGDVRSAAEGAQGFVAFAASILSRRTAGLGGRGDLRIRGLAPPVARRGDMEAVGARRGGTGISAALFGFGDH